MASGKYVANLKTYKQVLNSGGAYEACDKKGAELCGSANASGSGEYAYDTIYGKVRVHTRVKTADRKAFFKERYSKTLARLAERHK